ncbi:undecaprenyl-diphosphate phosphatase [Streptomyces sp. NP160]|uniref:undecaprenyl-diphosphate phosphatase n=1 Tax=Streptomyces sp. NP160 TaxID=2586637 RepID=UPI00111B6025|nr:undecaprenyl-diphosphate phosphatase [Streptomyces sp. NP160]TNM61923.1 undecaprenyl-diphosphate phosphatase [Streptomyces sp. NP160]
MHPLLLAAGPAASSAAHLSWTEATVIGLLQGLTELFPVSSLAHSVLLPAIIGGSWARDLDVSKPESPYLAFIVGLHVATAAALVLFYCRDWARITTGLLSSVRHRRITGPVARLGWLLVLATIPVGVTGLLLEHPLRTVLARPVPTAAFLVLNGVVLYLIDRRRRRAQDADAGQTLALSRSLLGGGHQVVTTTTAAASTRSTAAAGAGWAGGPRLAVTPSRVAGPASATPTSTGTSEVLTDRRLAGLPLGQAVLVGTAQIAALAPGISRSGITMAAGLRAGLSHQDAARFSFLLATSVIAAAGLLKLPDLFGPLGDGIRGQVLLGSALSGVSAYLAVRFLDRWFAHGSLRPYALYCVLAGLISLALLV